MEISQEDLELMEKWAKEALDQMKIDLYNDPEYISAMEDLWKSSQRASLQTT